MDIYRADGDIGKRKRFSSGCLIEDCDSKLLHCTECGITWSMPGFGKWFKDKSYNLKIYMSRGHHPDFTGIMGFPIVSTSAKNILVENFNNAVDFGDITMISYRDLSDLKIRDRYGYASAKQIPNDPPQYHRLFLKLGAEFDFQKTNIELRVDCSKCGRKDYATPGSSYIRDGVTYIIGSTWKGFDIFNIQAFGNKLFCTGKFVEIYTQNKLTGLEFEKVPIV